MSKAREQLEDNREHLVGDWALKADGSIPMTTGYVPVNDQDIATKISVKEEITITGKFAFDAAIFGPGN